MLDSVTNSNEDCSQESKRRMRFKRAARGELGKIIESKEMSLDAKAKIIHTLIFPVPMYRCQSWKVKMADRKTLTHLKCSVDGELYRYPESPERQPSRF